MKAKLRMLKKVLQQGAGTLKSEAYLLGYVEDFNLPRTKLGAFFSIL